LPNDVKYTILAYKKISNSFIFHKKQDFTIGDQNQKIELDSGQEYTLIIISTGTSELPKLSNENDFYNVGFSTQYNDKNARFLYQKIENFIPSWIGKELNITLKGSTSISITLDTSETLAGDGGTKILSTGDIEVRYSRPKIIKLANPSDTREYEDVILPMRDKRFTDQNMKLKMDFYDAFVVKPVTDIKLSIKSLSVDKISDTTDIDGVSIDINAGYKQTYLIKPMLCGAYTDRNKTNFRQFMCHNLGDGYSGVWTDKFVGNRYAWGRKQVVYQQRDNPYETGDVWTEAENPCPSGFRVPTLPEWHSILDNNTQEKLYDRNNKVIGFKIGNRLALFHHTDFRRYIWSTTTISTDRVYTIVIRENNIDKERNDGKFFGQAVRCIRKLPNE